jgi:putative Mg2+ transporter-C (MgtC) family protein
MWQELLGARHFEILPNLIALAVAYALAFPIGWNREHQDRSAGLRTFPLVAVAACGFIQAAEPLIAAEPGAMARVVEGVITGMGFIGGGAILQTKNSVKGTATAASLWITGAIGVSVGLGSYGIAIVLSVITFVTLWALTDVKQRLIASDEEAPGEP